MNAAQISHRLNVAANTHRVPYIEMCKPFKDNAHTAQQTETSILATIPGYWLSTKNIALMTGFTQRTVLLHLQNLLEKGEVEVEKLVRKNSFYWRRARGEKLDGLNQLVSGGAEQFCIVRD